MTYFLDTSAVVKRYDTREAGSAWVRALFDPAHGHAFIVASLCMVGLSAALSRKVRMGELTTHVCNAWMADFRASSADYLFIHVDPLVPLAAALAARHGLRAYDAIQLAAALDAQASFSEVPGEAYAMVTADRQLLAAAATEGLTAEDPNVY